MTLVVLWFTVCITVFNSVISFPTSLEDLFQEDDTHDANEHSMFTTSSDHISKAVSTTIPPEIPSGTIGDILPSSSDLQINGTVDNTEPINAIDNTADLYIDSSMDNTNPETITSPYSVTPADLSNLGARNLDDEGSHKGLIEPLDTLEPVSSTPSVLIDREHAAYESSSITISGDDPTASIPTDFNSILNGLKERTVSDVTDVISRSAKAVDKEVTSLVGRIWNKVTNLYTSTRLLISSVFGSGKDSSIVGKTAKTGEYQ